MKRYVNLLCFKLKLLATDQSTHRIHTPASPWIVSKRNPAIHSLLSEITRKRKKGWPKCLWHVINMNVSHEITSRKCKRYNKSNIRWYHLIPLIFFFIKCAYFSEINFKVTRKQWSKSTSGLIVTKHWDNGEITTMEASTTLDNNSLHMDLSNPTRQL